MKLKHIDNSFYLLTARQAKDLSIENRLPKPGHEIRADLTKLAKCEFLSRRLMAEGWRRQACQGRDVRDGWIKRTPLTYFEGKPVKSGVVWAVHVTWNS